MSFLFSCPRGEAFPLHLYALYFQFQGTRMIRKTTIPRPQKSVLCQSLLDFEIVLSDDS
jgi:hypothetical protein